MSNRPGFYDIEAIKDCLRIADAWVKLNTPGEPKSICRSPFREDRSPSFSIHPDGKLWHDHGTGDGGDVIDFVARAQDIERGPAIKACAEMAGVSGGGEGRRDSPSSRTSRTEPVNRPQRQPDEKEQAKLRGWADIKATFRVPTPAEIDQIAPSRGVSPDPVLWMANDGMLRVGERNGKPVFAIVAGDFVQIRPMTGKTFWDGGPKTLSLSEDIPSFIFSRNSGPTLPPGTRVMIAEGPIEFLSMMEAEARADNYRREFFPDSDYHPVHFAVAYNANSRLTPDDIDRLKGRRIRIIPDADKAGEAAGEACKQQLVPHGCTADIWHTPSGKDLGEALPNMTDAQCYQLFNF